MRELALRRGTVDDATVIAEFNARLAMETEGKDLDRGVLAAGVAALLADPHKGFYTVAEAGGEVVGQTLITFEWSDWRNGWFWWIQSVYVRADCRGAGVFRAIYDHLHAAAAADGNVVGIRLYVERENAAAQAVYKKLGLQDEGYYLLGKYPLI